MKKTLKVTPIQTSVFSVGGNLSEFLFEHLKAHSVREGSVVVITSKIVSLAESQVLAKDSIDKTELMKREADHDLGEVGYGCRLTIKHGLFIPSAGIDESNAENGGYILFPKDPFASAKRIYEALVERFRIKNLGVLITDSHTLPLRQGVTGIALSYWGFRGVKNMVGRHDLFGRPLKMTQMDLADGLASAAVLMMGEADEACPLALIENAPVEFCAEISPRELQVPVQEDLYLPLYEARLGKNKI